MNTITRKLGLKISHLGLKKLGLGTVVIGFSKGLVFVAPLLAGMILSDVDYAWMEGLLATAQPLSLVLTVGLGASFGVRAISEEAKIFNYVAYYHFRFISFSGFIAAFAYFIFSYDFLAIWFTSSAIGTLQFFGLIYRRKRNLIMTGFADVTVYLPLVVGVGFVHFFDNFSFPLLLTFLVAAYLALFGFFTKDYFSLTSTIAPRLKDYILEYKIGIGFAMFSLLSMLAMSGSRFFIFHFYSIDDLATYAKFFRLAVIMMVIFKIFTLIYFNNIYLETQSSLFKKYLFVGFITTVMMAILLVFQDQLHAFGLLGKDDFLWLSILVQVKLWIDGALLEPLIQRSSKAVAASIWFSIVLGFYLICLCLFELSLREFIFGTVVMQIVCVGILLVLTNNEILISRKRAIIFLPTFLIFIIYVITVGQVL